MKPMATLGLSHGFLLGVMRNDGVDFRPDINVILVAPKVAPPLLRLAALRPVRHGGRTLFDIVPVPHSLRSLIPEQSLLDRCRV